MKPEINVTPLIDVLLVLLIIFMVISPLTPAQFEAKIPNEPDITEIIEPNILTLVVKINPDKTLDLNDENGLGTINEPEELSTRLSRIFNERLENNVLRENRNENLPVAERIEKTVFIKAPKSIGYGEVVKVIDEVKLAGASPISLQIDDLQ